ncbi:MAG: uracil-DNA glycosylase, partial [Methanosarcinales archaeon]
MREKELQKLHKTIISCKKCPLYKTRRNAVPGEGPANTKIMFLGESPGSKEDVQGKPFVGPAGKVLDQLLKSIDLDRKKIFITSVLKCRPVIGKRNRSPKREEIETCKPYLEKQIEIIKPKVIVTLGNYALQTLLDK